jgi:hypothetical protein
MHLVSEVRRSGGAPVRRGLVVGEIDVVGQIDEVGRITEVTAGCEMLP